MHKLSDPRNVVCGKLVYANWFPDFSNYNIHYNLKSVVCKNVLAILLLTGAI